MIRSGADFGPMTVVLLVGVLVLVGLFTRLSRTGRMGRASATILSISLFCVAVAMIASFQITRQRQAQRGSSGKAVEISPPSLPELTIKDGDESDTEDENVVASVEIRTSDGDEPAHVVASEGTRKDVRKGRSSGAFAESRQRGRYRVSGSDGGQSSSRLPVALKYARNAGFFSVLLVLGYLFLDAGKHQRYIWPRRIVVAAAFTAVCVLLWRIGPLM
jgi:hypothetical protein